MRGGGEAIAVDENGLSVFDLVRYRRQDNAVLLCSFDLLEVNSEDIRQDGIEERKRRLAGLLRRPHASMALNEHYRGDGAVIYKHACALGCEGIISKRLGFRYRGGRSAHWLKIKNPEAPAVKREAEEDWGKR